MRCGEYNLCIDTTLGRIDKCLFDSGVVHFFCFDEQCAMGAIDECEEVIARIDGADDQVSVIELSGSMLPVGLEDSSYGCYIVWIGVDDIVFAITETTTIAATKGRT